VRLYDACIKKEAVVVWDATRGHPYAMPVAANQIQWARLEGPCNRAKRKAVALTASALPNVRANTGRMHPRRRDSSRMGPNKSAKTRKSILGVGETGGSERIESITLTAKIGPSSTAAAP
jgi:hypothetical protein